MERINIFYSKRKDLQKEIKMEKEDDPSEEIIRIEDKVKECDPYIGFLHPDAKEYVTVEQDVDKSKTDEVNYCKFHSNGFCKRGASCRFIHQKQDCKDHIENRLCQNHVCPDRHRKDCWFYLSRKGCKNAEQCPFLHRAQTEAPSNSVDKRNKELESSIVILKIEVAEKDNDIKEKRQEIERFKKEVRRKDEEIREKNEIIKNYEEEENNFSDKQSEDEEDKDQGKYTRKGPKVNQGLVIGHGHFGKDFEVREGMEDEANTLRKEWTDNMK